MKSCYAGLMGLLVLGLSGCQVPLLGEATGGPASSTGSVETLSRNNPQVANLTPQEIVVDDNPDQFMGAEEDQLLVLLGDADLIRRDGVAQVMQYRGDGCVLDLFMYGDEDQKKVTYIELRGAGMEESDRRACLANIIRSRMLTS